MDHAPARDQHPDRPPRPPRTRRVHRRWTLPAAAAVLTLLVGSMLAAAVSTGDSTDQGMQNQRMFSHRSQQHATQDPPARGQPAAGTPARDQPARDRPAAGRAAPGTDELLASMTLEEKVGQVFMTYGYGAQAQDRTAEAVADNRRTHGVDTIAELVGRYHLGGVIYFAWSDNLTSPAQIAGLSRGIQQAATASRAKIPALIAIDQEHGVVVRLPPPVTQFPGSMALGATRDPDAAATAAAVTADELRALGINTNLAPVADVNVNPANPVIGARSFSSDPALVSKMVTAQVQAFGKHGVAGAAKHFPGHGDTDVDSHFGLPIINHTAEELDRIDLPPFRAAVDADADMIMSAHIVVPALDGSGLPATISRPILTGLLRDRLGYQGVVITDALDMQGAQPYGADSARRVPVEAFKAGADILLMPPSIDIAYRALLDAVRRGEITRERLDASVRRVLDLKRTRGILTTPPADPDAAAAAVGTPEHRKQAAQIAEAAVTLVANHRQALPLRAGAEVLVAGTQQTVAPLAAALAEQGVRTRQLVTGDKPTQEQVRQATAAAEGSDAIVVTTNRVAANPAQQPLVEALLATGTPVVVAATREPYDLGRFPDAAALVATYADQPVCMQALARVLTGAVNPTGKLPVDVPGHGGPSYRFGHGLSYDTAKRGHSTGQQHP